MHTTKTVVHKNTILNFISRTVINAFKISYT